MRAANMQAEERDSPSAEAEEEEDEEDEEEKDVKPPDMIVDKKREDALLQMLGRSTTQLLDQWHTTPAEKGVHGELRAPIVIIPYNRHLITTHSLCSLLIKSEGRPTGGPNDFMSELKRPNDFMSGSKGSDYIGMFRSLPVPMSRRGRARRSCAKTWQRGWWSTRRSP